MARPTKLTPDVQTRIIQALADGKTLTQAAAQSGVSVDAIQRAAVRDASFAAALEAAKPSTATAKRVAKPTAKRAIAAPSQVATPPLRLMPRQQRNPPTTRRTTAPAPPPETGERVSANRAHLGTSATPRAHDQPENGTAVAFARRRQGQRPSDEERVEIKAAFLKLMAATGNVRRACDAVGIDRNTFYAWLEHDESFALSYHQAEVEAQDVLEGEAWRRGVDGVEKPLASMGRLVVDDKGKPITVKEYSDTLLVKLLGARHPKYQDRQRLELSGPGGMPLHPPAPAPDAHTFTLSLRGMSDEDLAAFHAIVARAAARELEQREQGARDRAR